MNQRSDARNPVKTGSSCAAVTGYDLLQSQSVLLSKQNVSQFGVFLRTDERSGAGEGERKVSLFLGWVNRAHPGSRPKARSQNIRLDRSHSSL